jgi:hypothetical protein
LGPQKQENSPSGGDPISNRVAIFVCALGLLLVAIFDCTPGLLPGRGGGEQNGGKAQKARASPRLHRKRTDKRAQKNGEMASIEHIISSSLAGEITGAARISPVLFPPPFALALFASPRKNLRCSASMI